MAFVPIHSRDRARQLVSFEGMELGERAWPTDFDAVVEWRNIAWVVFEVKHGGKDVPRGQRLALERFVADVCRGGKMALAAVVEHHVDDPAEDVVLARCRVREVYVGGQNRWRLPNRDMDARECMELWLEYATGRRNA